jgi:GH43 family beta-xylosidase
MFRWNLSAAVSRLPALKIGSQMSIVELRGVPRAFCRALLGLLLFLQCAFGDHLATAERQATFANPVVASGADPWVIRWKDDYYLSQSRRGASIWVNRFQNLSGIGGSNWVKVWTPPTNTPYSRNIWAPELQRIDGEWYIYFAADDGKNVNHRTYVLQGSTQNPQDEFVFRGKIAAPSDKWAIDGTVLKEGATDGVQNLYIAPMSDPLTISGERVRISQPEHPWEKRGWPHVNEGPEPLWHGEKLFIVYSASGSWTDHYCLGLLTWTGSDPLDPKSWVKNPEPIFSATDDVFGPGHCSFVKSRDGKEDWIVYHSAQSKGSGWRRQINMQRFSWNADGSPTLGRPIPPGKLMPVPSGDLLPELVEVE